MEDPLDTIRCRYSFFECPFSIPLDECPVGLRIETLIMKLLACRTIACIKIKLSISLSLSLSPPLLVRDLKCMFHLLAHSAPPTVLPSFLCTSTLSLLILPPRSPDSTNCQQSTPKFSSASLQTESPPSILPSPPNKYSQPNYSPQPAISTSKSG